MPDRRTFLRALLGTTAALAVPGLWTAGCRREPADAATIAPSLRRDTPTGPTRTVRLRAEEIEVEVAPGRVYRTWGYNGAFPGPELRVREGEQLQVVVENHLPEGTTIHWHGVPVPNAMDGVPGLTQDPIAPGETFTYTFVASPSGSYLYHSHVGLQLDRGLLGALIIEETTPHVSYDREYTLVLDDFLPGEPRPLTAATPGMGGRGMMGRGMMGGMMMDPRWTINGQAYPDAEPLEIARGERVRFRMVNHSMMLHPMHLHGHFFRVGDALKDTVLVPPHMGRVVFDFVADDPGRWFFHCHNLYHLESGMAREVRYRA